MTTFVALFAESYVDILAGPDTAAKTLQLPGGQTLTIRDHSYPLDDLFCYANGWYELDRHQVLHNLTYLEEVSEASCRWLESKIPNFHEISVKDLMAEEHVDSQVLSAAMGSNESVVEMGKDVMYGMLVHAAAKCLFGKSKGAVCDIANCASRACLLPGGTLGYTARGECEDVSRLYKPNESQ
mmetsp:Transcript_42300/g.78760  ORF Transcript_42300/g.78760 Transcript_42300/m.78760 type:complete len:183 (+) Transcript_42300:67-615(+)